MPARESHEQEGVLSVVATPIGNMGDITLRALETLRNADVILCEDTRVTGKLLVKYDIRKPLVRCDEKMERVAAEKALGLLYEGKRVALVSDAGTPGISDPGARLVAYVRKTLAEETQTPAPFRIEAIPGPSALAAALSIAGLDSTAFTFLGFPPHKKGRQTMLKEIAASEYPIILYESPHRIVKLLHELAASAPQKKVMIFRELTKVYEEVVEGAPEAVAASLVARGADRGEFVVIVV